VTIYVDLPSRTIVDSPSLPRQTTSIALKRFDCFELDVIFLVNGVAQDLASGAIGIIGIKLADSPYSGSYLASATDWVKSGSGATAVYTFQGVNLNTTGINAAFGTDPEPKDINAVLEIEWIEGSIRTRTNTLPVDLQDAVNQGDEGTPQNAPFLVDGGSAAAAVGQIQFRRDTLTNWTAANPVLAQGEPAYETDTGVMRIGDGVSNFLSLTPWFRSQVPGKYRFKADGTFELWNPTQGLWQSLTLTGAAGLEGINFGTGES
jgi:hypothetical protein